MIAGVLFVIGDVLSVIGDVLSVIGGIMSVNKITDNIRNILFYTVGPEQTYRK